ncbi:MAG: MFS transporter [Candidatus Promineifilaceae bacterium]
MALLLAILSSGIVFLDQTALNVAIPAIQNSFNANINAIQWIHNVYLLVLSVLMLIGGILGDIFGRVRMYIIGMGIFIIASVLCGFAPSAGWLIAGRFLQGIGGAIVAPAGLAIINAVVANERRGQALGIWGTFSPLIMISGPIVGGWLVDNASWRSVFFINVPLGLLAMFIAARYVPENRNEQVDRRLDYWGVFALMLALGGILIALIEGPERGWTDPLILYSLLTGAVGFVSFIFVESRVPSPLIPLRLFRDPLFSGINLLTLVLFTGLGGPFFFLTLNFQQVQGYSATQAGLAALPSAVAIFLLSRQVGKLSDRIGPRPILMGALLFMATGFLLLLRPGVGDPYWTHWFPGLLIYGLGIAGMVVPLTSMGLGALPKRQSGIASGINNAASRIGQMLSVAVFGAAMVNRFQSKLAQWTADLSTLPNEARDALLSQAYSLGETVPPEGISAEMQTAIDQLIKLAFVDSFRLVMLSSAVLVGVSLLILLVTIPHEMPTHD